MKLFVVTHGEYSDRHVVAITTDETKAEAVAALGSSGSVEEHELEAIADRLLQGFRRWYVSFLGDTDRVVHVRLDYEDTDLSQRAPEWQSYPNPPSSGRTLWEFFVNARDKAEAIKIASEQRRVLLALLASPKP